MDYFYFIITVIGIWVIMSLAANLVLGYAGQFTIGHVGYLAIGAYTTGILNIFTGMNFFADPCRSRSSPALVAMLTLIPLLRLGPPQLGLATLGLNVVIVDLIHNLAPRVQGAEGLFGLTMPAVMMSGPGRCAIVVVLTALCVWFSRILVSSPFGRTLRALRDRPDALMSLGKDVDYYRILVWTISGALAGLAGGLYTAAPAHRSDGLRRALLDQSARLHRRRRVGEHPRLRPRRDALLDRLRRGATLRRPSERHLGPGPAGALRTLAGRVTAMFRRQGLVGQYEFRE